jgi:hypothetical protein
MQIISGVNDNTLKMIKEITAESLQNYENPSTIASKLISLIGSKSRALAIARTEGTTAYNMGTQRSALDWQSVSGDVMYKVWIHSGSKRDPRITHIQAQNKPIPMNDNFNIGGVAMSMPGDKNGGASNIINCGCVTVYLSERLAKKRFPKSFEDSESIQAANTLKIASSIKEAKRISIEIIEKNTVLRVSNVSVSRNFTLNQFNDYNKKLFELTNDYNLSPHLTGDNPIKLSFNSSKGSYGFVSSYNNGRIHEVNFGHLTAKTERTRERSYFDQNGFRRYASKSKVDDLNVEISTLTHEFAHVISLENQSIYSKYPQIQNFWGEITQIKKEYSKDINSLKDNVNEFNKIYLGDYAMTKKTEFMAEAFTEYKLSSNPSKYAIKVGNLIDKYFKKK